MREANVYNLKKALIGHSIKYVDSHDIVLDDYSVLTIEDSEECCSHYSGIFDSDGNIMNNVITDVVLDDHIRVYENEAFRIVVMSEDKKIIDLSVVGNEGSGCYVKSVYFTVSGPFEKNHFPSTEPDHVYRDAWRLVRRLMKIYKKEQREQ